MEPEITDEMIAELWEIEMEDRRTHVLYDDFHHVDPENILFFGDFESRKTKISNAF